MALSDLEVRGHLAAPLTPPTQLCQRSCQHTSAWKGRAACLGLRFPTPTCADSVGWASLPWRGNRLGVVYPALPRTLSALLRIRLRSQTKAIKPFISQIAANDLAYMVYKVGNKVFATEANSTAFQVPLSDAEVFDGASRPTPIRVLCRNRTACTRLCMHTALASGGLFTSTGDRSHGCLTHVHGCLCFQGRPAPLSECRSTARSTT